MANEIRKTSLGMQAVGAMPGGGVTLVDERGPRAGAAGAHALGLGVTILIHAAVGVLVFVMNVYGHEKKPPEQPYEAIEAGLAIKKKSTNAPKSKLPPKEEPPPVKPPDAPAVAKNPAVTPPPEEKKKPPKPEPDPSSVFDKYRKMETKSNDDQETEGADDGSEYGTLERAKGDPYVGELIGRMTVNPAFEVPSVVSDTNLSTWGCVKLDAEGKILDRAIDPDHKSKSPAFNSAVERRLKQTTDMEQPVPDYLKPKLVGKFVCATYTSTRD